MFNVVIEFSPVLSAHNGLASGTPFKVSVTFLCISLGMIHTHNTFGFSFPYINSSLGAIFVLAFVASTVVAVSIGMKRAFIMCCYSLVRLVWVHYIFSSIMAGSTISSSRLAMAQLSFNAVENALHHLCCTVDCRCVAVVSHKSLETVP